METKLMEDLIKVDQTGGFDKVKMEKHAAVIDDENVKALEAKADVQLSLIDTHAQASTTLATFQTNNEHLNGHVSLPNAEAHASAGLAGVSAGAKASAAETGGSFKIPGFFEISGHGGIGVAIGGEIGVGRLGATLPVFPGVYAGASVDFTPFLEKVINPVGTWFKHKFGKKPQQQQEKVEETEEPKQQHEE